MKLEYTKSCTLSNKVMEPTAYSVRYASASGSGSCLALI